MLGLSLTDPDPDNEGDGGTISDEQVATLEALLQEVGADRARFLVYLRVADLHDLKASGYKAAVTALEAKRRAS